MKMSVCGLDCSECNCYNKECEGCNEVKGCPSWASNMELKICSLYDCARIKKKLNNCGECKELPCKLFLEYKDPKMSDEEHRAAVEKCVKRLKS